MDNYDLYIVKCKKLLNRFISISRFFCKTSCNLDGLAQILIGKISGDESKEAKLEIRNSYDYDYFAFAKSVKTLLSIRTLLNSQPALVEDSFSLIRTILENHIYSRYVRENIDNVGEIEKVIKNTIMAPTGAAFDIYTYEKNTFIDENGEKIGLNPLPRNIVGRWDDVYFSALYSFLCQFSHCNFAVLPYYLYDDKPLFFIDKENHVLLSYTLTIFSFTKVYEGIVTINGEDLFDGVKMKEYYDLNYDSLELQQELFNYMIGYYNDLEITAVESAMQNYLFKGEVSGNPNRRIVTMLEKMKSSLNDNELGCIDKSQFENNKYKRQYQEW